MYQDLTAKLKEGKLSRRDLFGLVGKVALYTFGSFSALEVLGGCDGISLKRPFDQPEAIPRQGMKHTIKIGNNYYWDLSEEWEVIIHYPKQDYYQEFRFKQDGSKFLAVKSKGGIIITEGEEIVKGELMPNRGKFKEFYGMSEQRIWEQIEGIILESGNRMYSSGPTSNVTYYRKKR